jgi:hypothetical protein
VEKKSEIKVKIPVHTTTKREKEREHEPIRQITVVFKRSSFSRATLISTGFKGNFPKD